MKFKTWMLVLIIVFLSLILVGCNEDQEEKDEQMADEQQEIYAKSQPIPVFDWSLERSILIQLYKLRNQAVNTWSVWISEGTGLPIDSCPSIGYPIPADSSLTNPLQTGYSGAVIEQAEPNGIFASKNTDATWVTCIEPGTGNYTPVYIEAKVLAYPYAVEIVDGRIQRVTGTYSSISLDITRPVEK